MGQTKATRDRLAQVAALLAQTHKGRQLIARGDRSDPAEEHFHALVEAAWTLASTSESSSTERIEAFASLAATLCSTWKQGRHLLNALLGHVAGAAPMAVLKRIQPDLEMIRKC